MGYQVDYLQVGNGETSGDCIAIRFGDLHSGDPNKQYVMVIDGGFKETGEKLVRHITGTHRFNTDTVDLAVATHLDRDHIGGLITLIEGVTVKNLLMQRPWLHAVRGDDAEAEAADARKSYELAVELEAVATQHGVNIIEPFAGGEAQITSDAYMLIIGPDEAYYEELLKDFDHNEGAFAKALKVLSSPVKAVAETVANKIRETLDPNTETLDLVSKTTEPENNSSAIIYFNLYGRKLLFTGDAGVEALHRALDYGESKGLDFSDLDFLHVPHHGSKHNVDTAFLDRIGAERAYISATDDSKKHPSPRVTNALVRRSIKFFTTELQDIQHRFDAPRHQGYGPMEPGRFVTEFEEDNE